MPGAQTLTAFFATAVLLALSPGPDNVFVLIQSLQRGWRVGLCVVCGLCSGLVLHTLAVALGLAALVAASPTLFALIQYCGAAWLLRLAWLAWRSPPLGAGEGQAGALPARHALRWVGRGFLMNVSNPKVLVFFLAFLPMFVDPARGSVLRQTVLLGALFMLATALVFGGIACASGWLGQRLEAGWRAQKWLDRASALVLVLLAVRLALVQR